jgi:phosphatidylserine/phosphatidylglycerophosphate/cardiolipin synthase-like enzyme
LARHHIRLYQSRLAATKAAAHIPFQPLSVQVILDKSQRSERYSGATFLANAGIRTLIDEQPSIAHSKVIIIDGVSVITGSFNFTRSAQQYNAENLIVIRDGVLARHYTQNWVARERLSTVY